MGNADVLRRVLRRIAIAIASARFPLIVFDLDGTLVDSRRDLADAANTVVQECGGAPHSEEAVGRMVGDGAATLVARAFTAAGIAQPADALARFLEVYNRRLLVHTRPYPGISELLETLHGATTLAVLTNKPLDATLVILDAFGWRRLFGPRVIGGDGPPARKPDPEGLLSLVAQAGVRAHQSLLVGDSHVDWQTAVAAGAASCTVRYGFGSHSFPWPELRAGDFAIDRPAELLTHL